MNICQGCLAVFLQIIFGQIKSKFSDNVSVIEFITLRGMVLNIVFNIVD